MPIPPISTTKTPPTLAKPNSLAVELDLDVSSYKQKTEEQDTDYTMNKSSLDTSNIYPTRTASTLLFPPSCFKNVKFSFFLKLEDSTTY